MGRPHDRTATAVALVNAIVVLLLPIGVVWLLTVVMPSYSNGSTTVVGRDPRHAERVLEFAVAYLTGVSPFAMAAAWRTFVHARRWLLTGARGVQGIVEAGVCGFAGAVFVLLPGIVTRPAQAPAYVIAYGGATLVLGLIVGVILWSTATLTLWFLRSATPR
jgi:hypothetical protein